jgi:mRNA turnover protein 4
MPSSKRSRVVALTQTAKKTRDHKSTVIKEVRAAIDTHDTLYLFSYENMRSNKFKNVRMHFREPDMEGKPSRIFLGKNKLLQIALGKTPEEEYSDNLRHVAKLTTGSVGLLLTSQPREDVESYFAELVEDDFARAGSVAPRKVVITNDMVQTHPVNMMEYFRKLGLPVEIDNGRVSLVGGVTEFTLCREGETLSAETCKALVHFGVKVSEFKVNLICRWNSTGGEFEMLN